MAAEHRTRIDADRSRVGAFVAQFRRRLRDRRFWIVQALVIGISLVHISLDASGSLRDLPELTLLPVTAYFVPVIYAALNFGVEGAAPTALWISLLTVPNLILWHTTVQRSGVVLQLLLLVALAYVIARRVDAETAAKERAEAATTRLARLNRTAAASSRSLELESVLSETAQAILDPGKSQTSWIMLAAAGADVELVTAATEGAPAELGAGELAATRSALASAGSGGAGGGNSAIGGTSAIVAERMAVVPLWVADRIAGAVGLVDAMEAVSADDVKLVEAVGSQLAVALANIRHFRQTQLMVGELSRARSALEEYVRLATDAQEEERKRLARELHDDTIQTLVIATAELDALATGTPVSASAKARLRAVEATLTQAIDGVRRFSRDLRPSLLDDLGLVDAIEWLVADLTARTEIQAELRTSGELRRLAPKDELALFRIVQEALRNVERHATARHARVHLHFREHVWATVTDDGTGFDTSQAPSGHHSVGLGLHGMRERAKLADATLSVRSLPATGTRITVTLPPARDPPAQTARAD